MGLRELWDDYRDWHGPGEFGAQDSIQSWGNVEEYLKDRHGMDSYTDGYWEHPTTIDMAKLHSMAQGKDFSDLQGPIPDGDLQAGAALGLLKIRKHDKAAKLPKTQQCEYCSDQATRRILHSEGMAYTPVCDAHLDKGTDAAEHCTPDGSYDPSNVVRVDKIGSNYYTEDDFRSGRPLPPPVVVHPDGRRQDFAEFVGGGALTAARLLFAMPRADAYDLNQRAQPPDQTPIRPGPWYHSTNAELAPGTVLDSTHANTYSYGDHLAPRDDWVWMFHNPAGTEFYGDHLYEVEPMGEGPYAYNGMERSSGGDGYVSPNAKVIREIQRPRPQESLDFADAMSRMGARLFGMAWQDYYDPDFKHPRTQPTYPALKYGPEPGDAHPQVWYHGTDAELRPGDVLDAEHPNNFDYAQEGETRDHKVFMSPWKDYAGAYGKNMYEVEPLDEGPYPWNGGRDQNDDGMPPYAAPRARVVRRVDHPWRTAAQLFGAAEQPLDSINPTGGLFVDYDPASRTGPHGPRVTTLDKARGGDPNEMVDIFRGAPRGQKQINPGDFITTDEQLAGMYGENVLRMQVPMRHVATDPDEWEGGEHVYSPREAARQLFGAVPGEIHRGISLDLDSPTLDPALRQVLRTHGPESPEFAAALVAHPGTYWTRDRGMAEGVNAGTGNGLRVVMRADWDGNGAQSLHPENTRTLPDSWGDMSLLAPAENAMGEFNLKPGKELNVKSIRVRRPTDPGWRELLHTPLRATAHVKAAMAAWEAYDEPDPDNEPNDFWASQGAPETTAGPWWHATTQQHQPGDVIEPNGGRYPSRNAEMYDADGMAARQDWVWMDRPQNDRSTWAQPNDYVYEVEPLDEGPHPWNGDGSEGHVSPRARVKRLVYRADRTAALLFAMPMRDAWDDVHKDQDSAEYLPESRRDIAAEEAPDRGWIHTSPRPHAVGDVLTPSRGKGTEYADYYDSTGRRSRQNWVWMSPGLRDGAEEYYRWATPDDYVYQVEPTTEGPFPWNGTGYDGYVAPEVRIKNILRQPTQGAPPPGPSWSWDEKPVLPSWEQPGATPDPLSTAIDGDPWKAAGLAVDERAMVLGMLTIPQLTAATYYHITDRPDFTLDPTHRPQNNTTLGGDMEPGVFMTQHAEPWLNGYGYWRPYVAEIEAPDDLSTRPGVMSEGYSGEVYAPASTYPEMKVNRVIPVDAYGREQYGTSGWIEDANGRDFQTGEPLAPQVGNIPTHPGYRYPGTVMDQTPEWRKQYQKQVRKYQRGHPSIM